MTIWTPIGMNPNGQLGIPQPGDSFTILAAVANTDSYNDLLNKPTNVSTFTNDSGYITSAALSGYATTTALAAKPDVYFGTTKQTSPKLYTNSFTITTAGTAVFNLTSDGTSTGTALMTLPNLTSLNVWVNDATSQYQASAALSNSNKTLTVTINKAGFVTVALLGLTILATPSPAAIGTVVNVQIWGQ